jgi:hypothetical protein
VAFFKQSALVLHLERVHFVAQFVTRVHLKRDVKLAQLPLVIDCSQIAGNRPDIKALSLVVKSKLRIRCEPDTCFSIPSDALESASSREVSTVDVDRSRLPLCRHMRRIP